MSDNYCYNYYNVYDTDAGCSTLLRPRLPTALYQASKDASKDRCSILERILGITVHRGSRIENRKNFLRVTADMVTWYLGDSRKTSIKTLLCIALVFYCGALFAAPYYGPKKEMVKGAEIIAIIYTSEITELRPYDLYGKLKVRARIMRVIKGEYMRHVEFFVPSEFPASIVPIREGPYLIFLRTGEDGYEGNNWHLSYRPISLNKVEWWKGDFPREFEYIVLDDVVEEINQLLGRKKNNGGAKSAGAQPAQRER